MYTKIFVVLFLFLLASVSPTFAGDQKPFEGWLQVQVAGWEYFIGNPEFTEFLDDYPDLVDLIVEKDEDASWTPLFVYGQLIKTQGHFNVGGKTTAESPQVVYLFSTGNSPWDPEYPDPSVGVLIGYTTMTVANGDKIFSEWQSVIYEGHGQYIGVLTIVGGTGRFEGATGSVQFRQGSIKNGQMAMILEGYIDTVGEAEEE